MFVRDNSNIHIPFGSTMADVNANVSEKSQPRQVDMLGIISPLQPTPAPVSPIISNHVFLCGLVNAPQRSKEALSRSSQSALRVAQKGKWEFSNQFILFGYRFHLILIFSFSETTRSSSIVSLVYE